VEKEERNYLFLGISKDAWYKLFERRVTEISVVCPQKKDRKWKEKLHDMGHLGLNQGSYIWVILFMWILLWRKCSFSPIFIFWSFSPSSLFLLFYLFLVLFFFFLSFPLPLFLFFYTFLSFALSSSWSTP